MITSLGPSEFADGLGLGAGDAVVVELGVDDADGCADRLDVGEASEPTGFAGPHAAMTRAQTAIPVARLAVIRSIGPIMHNGTAIQQLCLAEVERTGALAPDIQTRLAR